MEEIIKMKKKNIHFLSESNENDENENNHGNNIRIGIGNGNNNFNVNGNGNKSNDIIVINECWNNRLGFAQHGVDVWQRILKVRSLLLSPKSDMENWIKFAHMCRHNDRPLISRKVLYQLMDIEDERVEQLNMTNVDSRIVYAFMKHVWDVENKNLALQFMRQYIKWLTVNITSSSNGNGNNNGNGISNVSNNISNIKINDTETVNNIENGNENIKDNNEEKMENIKDNVNGNVIGIDGANSNVKVNVNGNNIENNQKKPIVDNSSLTKLLAKCHLRYAQWQKEQLGNGNGHVQNIDNSNRTVVLDHYLSATTYDKNSYKAWHGWALANFELSSLFNNQNKGLGRGITGMTGRGDGSRIETSMGTGVYPCLGIGGKRLSNSSVLRNPYIIPAIQGFFRSISLAPNDSLQDSLRLLTIWFKYGMVGEVNTAIADGLSSVPLDNWLQVIPQLIARIQVPIPQVRRLVHHLLSEIGKQHPQAIIYSLNVASKSQSISRRTAALALLDRMKSHSSRLVDQSSMISQELIRVAILWEEMWYEALEEASKLYFGENNVQGMLSILEPLHQLIERTPETIAEGQFNDLYGRELREAKEQCQKYKRSGNNADIASAWDIYYVVFRKITKRLPQQLCILHMESSSSRLNQAEDMEIVVPGTYRVNMPIVSIVRFEKTMTVISSKQRPRKISILGSDGMKHKFLLKGHEDLRQDERAMQLFDLLNSLLQKNPETLKRHLSIQRISVIPLSQNTGLIGWVPHCDTMHALIRDYRESKRVLLSLEHRLMLQFAPDYDNLLPLQKIEVFEHAMKKSDGLDLKNIMWQRAKNAESWLDCRITFTRSLAVMSMAGYILGLGDRHPSNLMIDRVTGKIVHIDFGDCFEVAQQREKFPERVPFRLTRMLVNAMEISGIEGTFRITCEKTMQVLRENKDSVMAVLEAFVFDPLINWRLLRMNNQQTNAINTASGLKLTSGVRSMIKPFVIDDDSMIFTSISKKSMKEAELLEEESVNRPEALNAGILHVINRVSNKLTGKHEKIIISIFNCLLILGRDFGNNTLDVASQVDRLIQEALCVENLCLSYVGW